MTFKTSFKLAWRALRHNKLRSWLTTVTIAAAISTIHVHYSLTVRPSERAAELLERFESSYLLVYDSLVTTLERDELDQHMPALQQAGVSQRHDFMCAYFLKEPDPLPLLMCSDAATGPAVMASLVSVVEGVAPKPDAMEVLVEADLASRWQVAIGDQLEVYKNQPKLRVTGFFSRSAYLPTSDLIAPLAAIQKLKNRPGGLSFSLLELQPGVDAEQAVKPVENILLNQHVLPPSQAATQLRAGSRGLRIAAAALAAVIASLCAAIALFALMSAVNERKREFAVLRTLGFTRRAIMSSVMLEGMMLGLNGAFKGVVIGEIVVALLAANIHPILGGGSRWHEMLLPFVIGVGVAMLGSMIPALRACYAQPQELLRA